MFCKLLVKENFFNWLLKLLLLLPGVPPVPGVSEAPLVAGARNKAPVLASTGGILQVGNPLVWLLKPW